MLQQNLTGAVIAIIGRAIRTQIEVYPLPKKEKHQC